MRDRLSDFKSDIPATYLPSIGEQIIKARLEDLGIIFHREVVFNELPFLRFDFYIPEYRLAIEYDGRQHFELVKDFYDTEESLKRRKTFDRLKNKFMFGSGGVMIRIKYDDDIIPTLHKKLKKYFPNNTELHGG